MTWEAAPPPVIRRRARHRGCSFPQARNPPVEPRAGMDYRWEMLDYCWKMLDYRRDFLPYRRNTSPELRNMPGERRVMPGERGKMPPDRRNFLPERRKMRPRMALRHDFPPIIRAMARLRRHGRALRRRAEAPCGARAGIPGKAPPLPGPGAALGGRGW